MISDASNCAMMSSSLLPAMISDPLCRAVSGAGSAARAKTRIDRGIEYKDK